MSYPDKPFVLTPEFPGVVFKIWRIKGEDALCFRMDTREEKHYTFPVKTLTPLEWWEFCFACGIVGCECFEDYEEGANYHV